MGVRSFVSGVLFAAAVGVATLSATAGVLPISLGGALAAAELTGQESPDASSASMGNLAAAAERHARAQAGVLAGIYRQIAPENMDIRADLNVRGPLREDAHGQPCVYSAKDHACFGVTFSNVNTTTTQTARVWGELKPKVMGHEAQARCPMMTAKGPFRCEVVVQDVDVNINRWLVYHGATFQEEGGAGVEVAGIHNSLALSKLHANTR